MVEVAIPMQFFSHSGNVLIWAHLRLLSPQGYLPTFCSIHCLFLTWMGCKVSSRRRYQSSCRTYFRRAKWGTAHSIVEATITGPFFLHYSSQRRTRGIVASTIPRCWTHIGKTVQFSEDTATCTILHPLRH